jgi:hypothetical protein
MEHDHDRRSTLETHGDGARTLATGSGVPGAPRDAGHGGALSCTSHSERRGAHVRCWSRAAGEDRRNGGDGRRGRDGSRRRRHLRPGGRSTGGRGMGRWRSSGADAQSNGDSDTQGCENQRDDTDADDRTSAYRDEFRIVVRHHDLRYFARLRKRRMAPVSPETQDHTNPAAHQIRSARRKTSTCAALGARICACIHGAPLRQ